RDIRLGRLRELRALPINEDMAPHKFPRSFVPVGRALVGLAASCGLCCYETVNEFGGETRTHSSERTNDGGTSVETANGECMDGLVGGPVTLPDPGSASPAPCSADDVANGACTPPDAGNASPGPCGGGESCTVGQTVCVGGE